MVSFAGDGQRQSTSQMNLQYFFYYAPTQLEIGMSPNMFVNWNAARGNQLTFPVGLGVTRNFNLAKCQSESG